MMKILAHKAKFSAMIEGSQTYATNYLIFWDPTIFFEKPLMFALSDYPTNPYLYQKQEIMSRELFWEGR